MTTTWGAIRWDFQYRGLSNTTLQPYPLSEAQTLGTAQFRQNAPLHFLATSPNAGTWNDTQATFDAEIAAAQTAGLKYWAFYRYGLGTFTQILGGTFGLQYYQASAYKSNINWCSICPLSLCGSTANYSSQVAALVTEFQQSNYQKVLTNRPLFFIYYQASDLAANWGGALSNVAPFITALRTACTNAGLGSPYVVVMNGLDTSVYSGIGADAISVYSSPFSTALVEPWTTYEPAVETYWSNMKALGVPMIPTAMMGWDQRARIVRPPTFEQRPPIIGLNNYVVAPTNAQITAHLTAGVNFINTYPTACAAATGLIYAWNECSECGGSVLIPTLSDPTGTRCAAAGAALIGN